MKILHEFKEFAIKGNVIDMAVGVIIGGAFGKIVSSLVNDIIMPPIGLLLGGMQFGEFKFILKAATTDAAGIQTAPVTINYGSFIQVALDFLIVASSIFFVIRLINRLKKQKTEQPAAVAEPIPTKEEILLTEIRDILKKG